MGITRRYRHINWTTTPDLEPDAPPTLHLFQCNGENEQGVLCGQQSAAGEDFETARAWSFQHLQANPDHRSYSHVLSRPWRMIPEIEPDPEPIAPLAHSACTPMPETTSG